MQQVTFDEENGIQYWVPQKVGGSGSLVAVLVPVHKKKGTTVADWELRTVTEEEVEGMNWTSDSFHSALKWWKSIGGQQKPFVEFMNAFNTPAIVERFLEGGDLHQN